MTHPKVLAYTALPLHNFWIQWLYLICTLHQFVKHCFFLWNANLSVRNQHKCKTNFPKTLGSGTFEKMWKLICQTNYFVALLKHNFMHCAFLCLGHHNRMTEPFLIFVWILWFIYISVWPEYLLWRKTFCSRSWPVRSEEFYSYKKDLFILYI